MRRTTYIFSLFLFFHLISVWWIHLHSDFVIPFLMPVGNHIIYNTYIIDIGPFSPFALDSFSIPSALEFCYICQCANYDEIILNSVCIFPLFFFFLFSWLNRRNIHCKHNTVFIIYIQHKGNKWWMYKK